MPPSSKTKVPSVLLRPNNSSPGSYQLAQTKWISVAAPKDVACLTICSHLNARVSSLDVKFLPEIASFAEHQIWSMVGCDKHIIQLVLARPSPPISPSQLSRSYFSDLPGRSLEVKVPQSACKSQARLQVGHCLARARAVADDEWREGLAHVGEGGLLLLWIILAASLQPALRFEDERVREVLFVVQERVQTDGHLGPGRDNVPVDNEGLATFITGILLTP